MKRLYILFTAIGLSLSANAQQAESLTSYKSLALQMSDFNANGDASSSGLPSIASFNGYGSFLDNPAVMALSEGSFYTIGWLSQSGDQTDSYLGTSFDSDFSNTDFSNLGLVYEIPTERGSFVIGGGYNLISKDYNDSFVSGFNSTSTITDEFRITSSTYNDIAFDAFAIDFRNGTSNELESIFRVDSRPLGFGGIYQYSDIVSQRTTGEINGFVATEFQKNLFAGISLGITTGNIDFDRNFQEVDEDNVYNNNAIPAQGANPATDIFSVTLVDDIDTEFYGFTFRAGFLYKVLPFVNVGASFTAPSTMVITEDYSSSIDTDLDDFTQFTDNTLSGRFEYEVVRPAEIEIGASLIDIGGLTLSAAAEYIDYGNTEVDFTVDTRNLTPSEVAVLAQDERATNDAIQRDYAAVINFKAGASYALNNGSVLRAGYILLPAKVESSSYDEAIITGGITVPLGQNISLDVSGQYSSRDGRFIIYETQNLQGQALVTSVDQEINRFNVLAGVKFHF